MHHRLAAATLLALALSPALAGDHAYWGTPSADNGRCCASLADVRGHIDAIDAKLIALMAERAGYVAEAGRFKKNPASVSAPARVEAIIAKVRAEAAKDGMPPQVAERTFRAMIAAFEDYEREQWRRHHGAGHQ